MSILDDFLSRPPEKRTASVPVGKRVRGASTDTYLTDELDRWEKYIPEEDKKKILSPKSALKHGVHKIGHKNDSAGVLGFGQNQLFSGVSKKAQLQAARYYSDKWAAKNLQTKIVTKSGKELVGKILSKNIYIKKVSYLRNGKSISYLQARNLSTGRIVKMQTALNILGKVSKKV